MYITMNSDYALRAMMQLAISGLGETIPISRISADAEIPESFLRKIIPRLQKAGLIRTVRGNRGGIELSKPADSISLLDIILPIEEHLGLHRCVLYPASCSRTNFCSMHTVWTEIEHDVRRILAAKSLSCLVNGPAQKAEVSQL